MIGKGALAAVGAAFLATALIGTGALPAGASSNHAARTQRDDTITASPALLHYRRAAARWDAVSELEPAPRSLQWHALRVDGVRRRYLLSVPPHETSPEPLVIGFHGLGQRASQFADLTQLAAATRAAGEVLAVPESEGPAWNDGRLGPQGPQDDEFALDLIAHLARQKSVNPERVTVTGFSNGAGMAMQFADTHPGSVAAVVSVSGDMISGEVDGSPAPRPTSPVRAVLIHGTADHVQPWAGRRARGLTWPAYISVPGTVRVWARTDRAEVASRRVISRRVDGVVHRVVCTRYDAAEGGAPVSFYAVKGMRHNWPVTTEGAMVGASDAPAAVSATTLVVDTARTAHARLPQPRTAHEEDT